MIFPSKNKYLKLQHDQVRKVSTGQGDDYTTCCLLDFGCSENNWRLIVADLNKQKALDSDSGEQPKETILQFSEGTRKVM